VGDGAADGTGKGESGVQSKTAELLGSGGLDVLLDGIHLGGAGGGGRGSTGGRHWTRDEGSGDGMDWSVGGRSASKPIFRSTPAPQHNARPIIATLHSEQLGQAQFWKMTSPNIALKREALCLPTTCCST